MLPDGMPDNEHPFAREHVVALVMCAFALFIDGFDVYLVGNLAPAIASSFDIAPAKLSLVFLLQQIGLAVGAFLIGPISDRVGRKKGLLVSAVAFGLLTLTAMLARSIGAFAILRGLAGIFLSGVIPNALAILMELTPRRRHGLVVSIAFTGYGAGSVGGAVIGALLLRDHGWQSGFWIGGIVPLLYALMAIRLLPESARFKPRGDAAVSTAAVHRILGGARRLLLTARVVFGPGRSLATCLIWGIFFLTTGTIALMFAWMPTFFHERSGIGLQEYSTVASFSLCGGLVGTMTIGYVLDRARPTLVLAAMFFLTGLAMLLLGHGTFGTIFFALSLLALSLFQGAGQTGASAVTAQFYPTQVRATGIGWAFGAGRIGGIVGPWAGGLMLSANFTISQFFLSLAAPMVVSTLLTIALDRTNAAQMARTGAA